MECSDLTFLNTTGASSLSGRAAKEMRAHITRTNFAKRRQRLTGRGPEKEPKVKRKQDKTNIPSDKMCDSVLTLIPAHLSPSQDTLDKLQELLFIEGRRNPYNPREALWFKLFTSEPVLVEATMAVAVRHWSPEYSWQSQADHHSYIAVNLLKERIASISTRPNAVLGAVITMVFGAALACDDIAWKIHIEGLVQIINDRESRDPLGLPSWLIDLIVQDSVNSIFGFPRAWHPKLIHALREYHDGKITKLSSICDNVMQLRWVINCHHQSPLDPISIAEVIEEPLAELHHQARALRSPDNVHIDAAARAVELVLHLLWPTKSPAHLTLLASELKGRRSHFPIRHCPYMDLTSYQLMVGAVAAEKGSDARAWFVDRVTRSVRWMQNRGWNEPLSLLEKRALDGDMGLMPQFRALWRELYDVAAIIDVQSLYQRIE
ncbi:uncharacterized protein APUU_51497A [Aspergillus puulaauensis]|uniref:Fungal-specific transcription factor domain-containing protein n=1 Tax=Aspergillus puulaauensis TaxID=1220207 RepID=A0A7R8APT5_9EURO|nr:uncharacterized protein APUU_51497A [Aspergillus puulaauensis]BCS26786.1 hypothetical protein APUU_51497A [Aspergillus puulaauensis]